MKKMMLVKQQNPNFKDIFTKEVIYNNLSEGVGFPASFFLTICPALHKVKLTAIFT
jgi:hypothetical protein